MEKINAKIEEIKMFKIKTIIPRATAIKNSLKEIDSIFSQSLNKSSND